MLFALDIFVNKKAPPTPLTHLFPASSSLVFRFPIVCEEILYLSTSNYSTE